MAYDTSPSGIAAGEKKQNASLADQKAGSPLGASGTYSDQPNTASPDKATIANNFVNSHSNAQSTAGSTSDTGRTKP